MKKPVFAESSNKGLLRKFSETANTLGGSGVGAKMSFGTSVIFMLNSLTGLSLLTLPYGFGQTGFFMGALLLFGSMALAFVTATFMCEALTIANALTYEEAERQVIEAEPGMRDRLRLQLKNPRASTADLKEKLLGGRLRDTVGAFQAEIRANNVESEFKIRERVELGQMGELVLHSDGNKMMATLIYVMIISFTYGTASALTVTVNESLSHTACSVIGLASPGTACDEDFAYKCSVFVAFFITLPLCFADLQKTKKFTMIIMVCRFIAIGLMLLIAGSRSAERLAEEGASAVLETTPLWIPGNFMAVFGNAVFLFGIHHYLPSMISPLEPQVKAPRVIATAFISCYVLLLCVCGTGLVAWGGQDSAACSSHPGGHFCRVQPLYNLNFVPLNWLGGGIAIFITAYPAMAIASIPIAVITTRNTLARWLNIALPADNPYALKNAALTLAVLVPPNIVALITKDVQAVIAYVGGYAGLTVAVLCPLVLLVKSRRMLDLDDLDEQIKGRPLQSPFGNTCAYGLVIVWYVVALVLVTKKLFFTPQP